MNLYEKQIHNELNRWEKEIVKGAGFFEKITGNIQTGAQKLVPSGIQNSITVAVEKMVRAILSGSGFLTVREYSGDLTLAERDYLVRERFKGYHHTAVVQGAGFGAGGILLGLADFPALLSIKMKFLFDCAELYGFDTSDKQERLFILHVFQVAFSGKEHRLNTFWTVKNWEYTDHSRMDWERFQIEYRDYLDVAKLLQLLPLVGSVAGGTANHRLMNRLLENAMNCYRMRILNRSDFEGDDTFDDYKDTKRDSGHRAY